MLYFGFFYLFKRKEFDIDEVKKGAPKIFLDCRRCDRDYIRTEIPFAIAFSNEAFCSPIIFIISLTLKNKLFGA